MARCGRGDAGDGGGDSGRGGPGGTWVYGAVRTTPWRRRRAGGEPGTDGAEATLARDVRRKLMDAICGRVGGYRTGGDEAWGKKEGGHHIVWGGYDPHFRTLCSCNVAHHAAGRGREKSLAVRTAPRPRCSSARGARDSLAPDHMSASTPTSGSLAAGAGAWPVTSICNSEKRCSPTHPQRQPPGSQWHCKKVRTNSSKPSPTCPMAAFNA
ncbi:hypothetical protein JB92DRAFT_3095397 [Gautieria morchelliformis]|nr:hypothetical protein JB92DRAFT_3095397 [Gautieria morchelliformis]